MNLPFANGQDAAIELRRKHFPGFHVLPYNRFDVEHSQQWWLSPTSEKAAFKYGKGIFTTENWAPDGGVFCGFKAEKGQRVADGGKSNQQMTDDWFWHRFLELSNTPLLSAVEEARKAIDQGLQLCVACGIPGAGTDWERVRFKIMRDQLEQPDFQPGDGMLGALPLQRTSPTSPRPFALTIAKSRLGIGRTCSLGSTSRSIQRGQMTWMSVPPC